MTEAPGRVTFRDVFAVAEFRALWFAEIFSIVGDQMARVALSVLVFKQTGSATLTGLTYALTFAPSLLGGILLTGLADRFSRRNVMITADLIRAALILLIAIPGIPFWLIGLLVALATLLNPLFKASQLATLPDILKGDRFITGMAIRNITSQSAQLLGFAGGGVLISQIDPRIALVIDAATFVLSAAILRLGMRARPAAAAKQDRPSFFGSISQGSRLVFADPGLRTLLLITWLMGLLPVYEGIAAPYASVFGDASGTATGLILASDPLGSVLGAFIFTRWVPASVRPRLPGLLSLAAAVPLLLCFLQPGLVVSLVLFVLSGGIGTVALMQATASLSLGVPDSSRAQAMGLSNTGLTTVLGVSPLIGGLLTDMTTPQTTVAAFGTAGLLAAIPLAIAWHRNIRKDPERWVSQ
ncbi:MFS transporter [Kibdelosporangium phytohabitans]|uniref:MFS transporter n=1 Tax=Kibdelosporangium phytohabitans TaxID=860235 RepID=A0A0N9ID38_9PSEU|nr:MFS transporter [Kibdelosporangium phytohabitans]ALG14323.1 MFS transporter [Kibdelosporangium phytohabitans]MBE1466660.1 MFS family permease [Kibdelosporangium phytohabitans]